MTESILDGRVSKTMDAINSIYYTYDRSKTVIEQHGKKYQQQLEQIENEFNEYLQSASILFINTNRIVTIVIDLIQNDQYKLHIEFEQRSGMFNFDAQEYQ
ncbi:unnamed protein product [Rotaria sp. Silwood2]|nr:unnamed protein product [Rotaria sp. Silwood2]CAF4171802.1 unnamed protein product [Rotaria sp. Silwood2]